MMEGDENLLEEAPFEQNQIKIPLIYGWGRNDDGELGVQGDKKI